MQKYLTIYLFSCIHTLKNYKALIGLGIFLITCLIIFANLWKLVSKRIGTIDLDEQKLLWYIALNEWVLISLPDIQEEIEQDLKTGRLSYVLSRPISYLGSVFAEALGVLSVNLLFLGIIAFAFTWWQAGEMPFSMLNLFLTLLFALLAGVIGIIFLMSIGLTSFWITEVTPIFWIWEKLLFMLGGLILPLAAYPSWIQSIASWTPFPILLGDRSALFLSFTPGDLSHFTIVMLSWAGVGLFFLLILYKRGMRILNIEGG